MVFEGVYTAIVTPFENGQIDVNSLTRVVEAQLAAGITGIVACGTTGESATLSDDEIIAVTRHVLEVSRGECQVIAGVGSNATAHTCTLLGRAQELGVDGALVITPYYNKPSQSGLVAHFEAVSSHAKDLPLMLYTVPGRTGVSLDVNTFERLSRLSNVVSLKDATADLALSAEYIAAAQGRATILSGDDITALPLWTVGGRGVVSVAANLCPDLMMALWQANEAGAVADAATLHQRLVPLFRSLFVESNPSPAKYLMAQVGLIEREDLRLPLVPVGASSRELLSQCFADLGLS
ncbi:MAG: 4-hydroxy-tetrahydrodipicolinate synthase [Bradymonadia bacterium]